MPTASMADVVPDVPAQGGTASIADLAPEHQQASSWLDSVERFGKGFYDKTLKGAVDLAGAAGHAVTHPQETAAAVANSPLVQHPVDTVAKAAKDAYDTHVGMLGQARASFQKGDYQDAMQRGTNALIPVLGPQIQASVDKAKSGDVAGGLGELAGMLTTVLAATPGVADAVASKAGDLADALGIPGAVKSGATKLYQSALKPSQADPEEAAAAVQAGLENRIPISKAGQDKISNLIQDLQGKVKDVIASNPDAPISRQAVSGRLNDVRSRFATQAIPQNDLATIDQAAKDFTAAHPEQISAAQAQAIKQGTYQQLGSKTYGEVGTAQRAS